MRRATIILLFGALLGGCEDAAEDAAEAPAAPAAEAAPTTGRARMNGAKRDAPLDPSLPLDVAKPDEARVRLDLAGVRAAIREHQMLNGGQNPKSIQALDLRLSFPGDIDYDPRTGRARSRTYPRF